MGMPRWLFRLAALVVLCLASVLVLKVPVVARVLDGPDFCGTCHVMEPQVDSYLHSGHREVAACRDCHLPHGLVEGAFYKAYSGAHDVAKTVLGTYETPVTISAHGKDVVQENCLRCHRDVTAEIGDTRRGGGMTCFDCHRFVPHLR